MAMGPEVADLARYFDLCRRKRNVIDYDLASTASEVETSELIGKVGELNRRVEQWIDTEFPQFSG